MFCRSGPRGLMGSWPRAQTHFDEAIDMGPRQNLSFSLPFVRYWKYLYRPALGIRSRWRWARFRHPAVKNAVPYETSYRVDTRYLRIISRPIGCLLDDYVKTNG